MLVGYVLYGWVRCGWILLMVSMVELMMVCLMTATSWQLSFHLLSVFKHASVCLPLCTVAIALKFQ